MNQVLYLSRLEEELMAVDTKLSYSILAKEELLALNSLSDNTSIIIRETDKGSGAVVWNREDYLKKKKIAEKQFGEKETDEDLSLDHVIPLVSILNDCLSRINNRGDIPNETL